MTFVWPWFLAALARRPARAGCSRSGSTGGARSTRSRSRTSTCSRRSRRRAAGRWRWVPLALFLLALASASAALARPKAKVSVPSDRATIVLLVDVSGSMRATDVKPTRLGAAQAAMGIFADKVPKGVKIGLVSFSSSADLLVIPTTDRTRAARGHRPARAGGGHGDRRRARRGRAGRAGRRSPASRRARTASCRQRSCCSPTARRRAAC